MLRTKPSCSPFLPASIAAAGQTHTTPPKLAKTMALPRRACARAYLLLLVLLHCCGFLRHAAAQSPPAADEAQLLLQIKSAWGDPSVLASWNASSVAGHCTWPHVQCDTAERVTGLFLANANVTGPFPGAFGNLSALTHLDVSNNSVGGAFPTSLYRCRSLQYLNLSQNYFGGALPADIGNGLSGNLTTLDLNGNSFNNAIPASLSRLRSLQFLALNSNLFTGTIPAELGELTELEVLFLYNNYLTGSIPSGIWSLKKLQQLLLSSNKLTGDVVVDTFAARNLTMIDLSNNTLSGTIPEAFGSLKNLSWLYLFLNNFSGEIPASIGRLPSLLTLRLDSNKLNGTLPSELGKHSPTLGYIQVDGNELTGTIPEGLCDRGPLLSFTASKNRLNGSIPAGLANCATLQWLRLESNHLSGDLPEALLTATQLGTLLLRNNRLTGSLPSTMVRNLTTLSVDNNQIGGSIPAASAALTVFTASNNRFSGDIPASLGNGMPQLQRLILSGNQLSGGIPGSLGNLKQLTQMDFSKNQLTGEIPAELGAIPVLSRLDLSFNKLSGDIPMALAKPSITSLNLSANQLTGKIPVGLATAAYGQSFLDNPGLCTAAAPGPGGYLAGVRSCAAGSQSGTDSSGGVSHALRTGLLTAGAALFLIAAAFAFFVVREVKKRRRLEKLNDWKMTPFQVLDFGEKAIVRGLTEDNLVGRGGSGRVYRVPYTNRRDGSAGLVAVKQIRISAAGEKLEREFESEASVLGNVRHNNIVRLLCCLSGPEARLLVYEYLGHGSLDTWLHGDAVVLGGAGGVARARSTRRRAPLDWPTRIQVAVGAAQGLCYMHHECEPPIVHRDVKSSNILLDSEFRAKVADFGLARMLVRAGAPETMSAVAGSFGYMAPECGYTKKLNEKVDVYSFGVVLLELTTGKTANDGGEHGCLADWARHHYQSRGSVADATDKCVRYAGYADEIEVVFRLGVLCTSSSPSSRPTMKDVLQILIKCSEKTHEKSKAVHNNGATPEYEAAPFLLPQRGSRRKQLSNGTGIDIEEKNDFDSYV